MMGDSHLGKPRCAEHGLCVSASLAYGISVFLFVRRTEIKQKFGEQCVKSRSVTGHFITQHLD